MPRVDKDTFIQEMLQAAEFNRAKPEPDSREWWREVAQGLGVKCFAAQAAHDALAARVVELEARLTQVAPHICPECGPFARVDEEGCCAACGADTYFESDPYKTATRAALAPARQEEA